MSRIEPRPKPEPKGSCWDCGATNWADARGCWLCHRRDWKSGAIAASVGRTAADDEPTPKSRDRADKAARVSSIASTVLISLAAFVFVTVVLPLMVIGFVTVALVIALNQFCSALTAHPP